MPTFSVKERWQAVAQNFDTTFKLCGNVLRWREEDEEDTSDVIKLSHKDACASFRLTYALCYYSAQGTTIRDKNVLLFHTHHEHFDLRYLNVGLSRVTHGKYMHVLNVEQENILIANIQKCL